MSETKTWICTVKEAAQAAAGQVMSEPYADFCKVGTDSRADLNGKLFIPLKGDSFDGHNFVAKAVAAGVRAVIVSEWRDEWEALKTKASFIKVANTLQTLQTLGLYWRRKHGFKVLAITGSNGKTSTKEFTYALLKRHLPVHASKGSFNNHWGVPLSILDAGPEHSHLILEMGMNHSGEIWRLCQISEPDIVTCTTVGRAHIGELGSQQNVAQAKEEIYVACPKALQVFNGDNEWTMRMQARSQAKQIVFSSFKPTAEVHMRAQKMDWNGLDLIGRLRGTEGRALVRVLGRHNVVNLMCASALALAADLTPAQIWEGLGQINDTAWGRNQLVSMKNGAKILFDAYNANPDSVQALFKNLYEFEGAGRKFLVMGDMRELGSFSEQAHEEAGDRAASIPFEAVYYVGEFASAFKKGFDKSRAGTPFFTSAKVDAAAAQKMLALLADGDLLAIKGSRGMELEHVLDGWPLSQPLGKKPG
jgi:UDP-N-acetylmuramoyl-tripeptide--D-alanyl-D-alanine ligase